ncbi:MAG TPA: hypothetical protein VJX10_05560 [Pseudonocardiaceae bacterium]|nr:hypothetical protein [Pseudonocardiaceae bacterium]
MLFVWAVGALLGGGDTPAVRGTANERAEGAPLATTPEPPSNPPPTGLLHLPGSPSSSASSATNAPMTTSPTTTTTTTTPAPPRACPDSVMRVTVTTPKPVYQVGDQPVLTLHIANAGPVACLRDVSHQLRSIEIIPVHSRKPLWASNYCYQDDTDEIRLLRPGREVAYTVRWAGRTAAPGCPADRTTVPAGTYDAVGILGAIAGPRLPITLVS